MEHDPFQIFVKIAISIKIDIINLTSIQDIVSLMQFNNT